VPSKAEIDAGLVILEQIMGQNTRVDEEHTDLSNLLLNSVPQLEALGLSMSASVAMVNKMGADILAEDALLKDLVVQLTAMLPPKNWKRVLLSNTPVCFTPWYSTNDRYERFQRLTIFKGATATLGFRRYIIGVGGDTALQVGTYKLLANGMEIAAVNVTAGARAEFAFSLVNLAEGWYIADIVTPGELVIPWAFYVQKGTVPVAQEWMPAITGSYTIDNLTYGVAPNLWREVHVDWVPAKFLPVAKPLTVPRLCQKPTVFAQSAFNCEEMAPVRWGDIHRPNRNVDGLISTFDSQAYFFQPTFIDKYPKIALLDGERGVGSMVMATDFKASQAVVNGAQIRTVYFCDPWRFGKQSENGKVTTLAGYRHKDVLAHWEDPANLELIGDWSAIPAERRGFHEMWGMAWDDRTFVLDPNAPPINGQQPHVTGPVVFFADTQNNRIVKGTFDPISHTTPLKLTEFLVGLQDPWDLVFVKGELIFTERKAHRIVAYSADTGQFLRVVLQGAALATVDSLRNVVYNAGQNPLTCQAQPCVAPEGIFFQDDWIQFSSKAQQQVRKVRPDGSELKVVRPIPIDGNSRYAKLALDDGSFYERGTSLTMTWSNTQNGGPSIYSPAGVQLPGYGGGNTGGTGDWVEGNRNGYGTAVAVCHGAVYFANCFETCIRVTKTQPGDIAQSAAVVAGRNKWHLAQYEQRFGHGGFCLTGEALPWGQDPDIDAYLRFKGQ
jgi:hypothetical protein